MGADIHGVLQSRFKRINGEWSSWWTECAVEDTRSYAVFSVLAGVRNYYGLKPIAELRGLPEGFAEKEMQGHDEGWMGEHSFTWLTIEEILNSPAWDQDSPYDGPETLREHCATFLAWCRYADLKTEGNGRIVIGFDS